MLNRSGWESTCWPKFDRGTQLEGPRFSELAVFRAGRIMLVAIKRGGEWTERGGGRDGKSPPGAAAKAAPSRRRRKPGKGQESAAEQGEQPVPEAPLLPLFKLILLLLLLRATVAIIHNKY